jgi:hypothetical protein
MINIENSRLFKGAVNKLKANLDKLKVHYRINDALELIT